MITLIAKMKIKEGKMDEAAELFKELVKKVREEKGTVSYAVCRNGAEPDTLTISERYQDMEAIQAHSSSSYFKEFSRTIAPLLDGKPAISLLEEIASI
ncbi:MAG: antibiotic biosynthesis monooxygenase [Syntrophales bacterium]|jgi:quinol monooxygenase YgiN|nr:antibiotic biosynthesis monooxygenase [Syntrophales bacterium]